MGATTSDDNPRARAKPASAPSPAGSAAEWLFGGLLKPSLLRCGGPIETVSNLPGRVRFGIFRIKGDETAKSATEENLMRLPGVTSVEVNLITGSVLIHYEPGGLTPELLLVALLKILDLEEEFLRTPPPVLARELAELGDSANRAVYQLTGGITDLWTGVFVALLALGVSRVARDRGSAIPGGLTLLYWAWTYLFRTRSGGA